MADNVAAVVVAHSEMGVAATITVVTSERLFKWALLVPWHQTESYEYEPATMAGMDSLVKLWRGLDPHVLASEIAYRIEKELAAFYSVPAVQLRGVGNLARALAAVAENPDAYQVDEGEA